MNKRMFSRKHNNGFLNEEKIIKLLYEMGEQKLKDRNQHWVQDTITHGHAFINENLNLELTKKGIEHCQKFFPDLKQFGVEESKEDDE